MKIWKFQIEKPVKFIADIGSNHNQNLERAIKLIRVAKEIGCSAVKFQMFKAENLYSKEFPDIRKTIQKRELPLDFIPSISKACKELQMEFHMSIFDKESLFAADDKDNLFDIDAYKIGSYEILRLDLVSLISSIGKPIGISTGGATFKEIHEAYTMAEHTLPPEEITIYHCIPTYPAIPEQANLSILTTLRVYLGNNLTPLGWSDHTVSPAVIYAAISMGAEVIEFHLDLDDTIGYESAYGHCWTPDKIKEVIQNVRIGEDAILKGGIDNLCNEMRKWRNDPHDHCRPIQKYRQELSEGSK